MAVVGTLLAFGWGIGIVAAQTNKLSPIRGASHALNRLAFGPRPGQALQVARIGWQPWIEQQMNPEAIEDRDVEARLAKRCPSLKLNLAELQALGQEERAQNRMNREKIKFELRESALLRAVYSNRQFQEVMVEFWRNHFNVDVNKVPFLATHYEEHAIRPNVFGKFEDLLLATARHPAMLVYLDNFVSNRWGVNENYARELMELHTLGVDNGYTQADVVALARVLTGWTCGWRGGEEARDYAHFFNENAHDASPQTVVGLQVDGQGGVEDGEKVIRHLARHPRTARFIASKLCRYLVNDEPAEDLVARVAKVFRESGGDLREVYRTIIFSPDFTDQKNYRAKFKRPFEYLVSVLRVTGAEIDHPRTLFRELALMGQPIFECVEPTGYADQREAWLDPGVIVYRWNFSIQLATDKVDGVRLGEDFKRDVLKPELAKRPQKVLDLILPGVTDKKTETLMSHTNDLRAMVAYALGSPAFQQQ